MLDNICYTLTGTHVVQSFLRLCAISSSHYYHHYYYIYLSKGTCVPIYTNGTYICVYFSIITQIVFAQVSSVSYIMVTRRDS